MCILCKMSKSYGWHVHFYSSNYYFVAKYIFHNVTHQLVQRVVYFLDLQSDLRYAYIIICASQEFICRKVFTVIIEFRSASACISKHVNAGLLKTISVCFYFKIYWSVYQKWHFIKILLIYLYKKWKWTVSTFCRHVARQASASIIFLHYIFLLILLYVRNDT